MSKTDLQYDPEVPVKLQQLQSWFGSVIASPLHPENFLLPQTPERDFKEEATHYILPRLSLEPYQRIGIYHQQYWWRLLSVLHDNFPLLTRVLGYSVFNFTLAIPFLCAHPPQDFALCRLGSNLPRWIRKNFPQKKEWLEYAQIDWATNQSFWEAAFPPLQLPLQGILSLQPHTFLLRCSSDMLSLRSIVMKEEVAYWQTHPFPTLKKEKHFFLIYRSKNTLCWRSLSFPAYLLLQKIQKKIPLEIICAEMEQKGFNKFQEEMPLWLFEWAQLGIFFDSINAA